MLSSGGHRLECRTGSPMQPVEAGRPAMKRAIFVVLAAALPGLIAGMTANLCIESTGRHAMEKGYDVTFLSNPIGADSHPS